MIKPYNTSSTKKEEIGEMFDKIAPKYDFLNKILSMNIDRIWRKKVRRLLSKKGHHNNILDIATGTGDLAIELSKLSSKRIVGLDLSANMLEIAKQKVLKLNLDSRIIFTQGDAENMRFADSEFDTITVAFGVRNFENIYKGLSEIYRVLMPTGNLVILELTQPKNLLVYKLYCLYFQRILPRIGKFYSKDYAAYKYLPASVKNFSTKIDFVETLKKIGFTKISCYNLSMGIATIYFCEKF